MPLVRFLKALLLLLPVGFSLPLHAQLNVDFIADVSVGCAPLKVSFTNRTTGVSSGATYRWDLGNGNNAIIANPSAIYTDTKTYNVTLTVSDNGKTSSKTIAVTVHPPPTANFTVSSTKACSPAAITFTSTAQPGGGNITDYYWDFGDGATEQGSGPSISHIYQQEQEVPVSLTVKNNFGCSHTVVKAGAVKIMEALKVDFDAKKQILCDENDRVEFINKSSGPGTLTFKWEFGDGKESAEQAPAHTFGKKGFYTVRLSAKSSEGCEAEKIKTDHLNIAAYEATIVAPPKLCTNTPLLFEAVTNVPTDETKWEITEASYSVVGPMLPYQFSTAGAYSLKLFTRFGDCYYTADKTIRIGSGFDIGGFSMSLLDSCGPPARMVFSDTSKHSVSSAWKIQHSGIETSSTEKSTTFNIQTTGTEAYITLTGTNADGCTSSVTQTVPAMYLPSYYISAETTDGSQFEQRSCKDVSLKFAVVRATNHLDVPITSFRWEFGDGSSSTEASPTHIYSGEGTYAPSLHYTTRAGCTGVSSYFREVVIVKKSIADFTVDKNTVCGSQPVVINNLSQHYNNYYSVLTSETPGLPPVIHHFGGNTIEFAEEGLYTIGIVSGTGSCADTAIKKDLVRVNYGPFPHFGPEEYSCKDRGEVVFSHLSYKTEELIWNFGDGSAPQKTAGSVPKIKHTFNTNGVHVIELTAISGGCTTSRRNSIAVLLKQQPSLSATSGQSVCRDENIQVAVSNLAANRYFHKLDNLQGSERIGYYEVRYVDEHNQPLDDRIINKGGFRQYFSATILNNQPITSIKAISTSLGFGCEDTTNLMVFERKGSQASFSILTNNVCAGKAPVRFKDESYTFGNEKILLRTWHFGDGNSYSTDKEETVEHVYQTPGLYYVTLRITDSEGCSSSVLESSNWITIKGPAAAFSVSGGDDLAQNASVVLYNETNSFEASDTEFTWTINGTAFSSDVSPEYHFTESGTFDIKLIASSKLSGCNSSFERIVKVAPFNYGFRFTATNIGGNFCPPVLVSFENISTNFTQIEWDFGDGHFLKNVFSPSHIYEKAGKYIVTLTASNAGGLVKTFKDSVVIISPATAIHAPVVEACRNGSVLLEAIAGNADKYYWDMGDGVIVDGSQAITYTYKNPGNYRPALLMKDANGCADFIKLPHPINIHADPVVAVSAEKSRLCLGESTTLSATGALTYEWASSDAITSFNTSATLATPGTSSVFSVKGLDDIGCSGTGSISIEVVQPQKVTVSPDAEICLGEDIQLQASGTDRITWINDLTGLDNPGSFTPIVRPEVSTRYTVQGTDRYNCFTSEAYVNVTVNPLPSVSAGNDLEVLAGTTHQLNAVTGNGAVSLNWSPGTYLSCNNCPNPIVRPMAEMQYVLTATTAAGCKSRDTVLVKLQCEADRIRIPNGFTPNGDGHNDHFLVKGIGIIKHMVVYSRWGDKVFERSNFIASEPANAWNGYIKGLPAPAGTYVYFIELQCPGGQPFTKKGTVTLMR